MDILKQKYMIGDSDSRIWYWNQ